MAKYLCWIALVSLFLTAGVQAEDWPRWLGPDGASNWTAQGIETEFGDKLNAKWRVPCGVGYAGPVVVGGKVYLFDYEVVEGKVENNPGRPVRLNGNERLHCINAEDGAVLWTKGLPVEYYVSYPSGPRATPCIDGDRIYTLGTEGDLVCRQLSDGSVMWHVNFLKKFGTKTPIWGHSSCPLVVGDLVYCMVGGEGSAIVAFDKRTGEEEWRALSSTEPGYAAPVAMQIDSKQCVAAFHPRGVSILDAESGSELWTKPIVPKYAMSISVPRRLGTKMFVSGFGEAMMVDGVGTGDPKITWKTTSSKEVLQSANASPYFAEDAIYGCNIESSELMAIDPDSGERLWSNREVLTGPDAGRRVRYGTGFIVKHTPSGRYFIFNEQGELISAELSREGITILSRAKIIEPAGEAFGRSVVWTHPAFAEGCVFARNDKEVVCVSLKQ